MCVPIIGDSEDRTADAGALATAPDRRIPATWGEVPWRTIVAVALVFSLTGASVYALVALWRIVVLVIVAAFFAVVLAPAVNRVQPLVRGHRGIATAIVMFGSLLILALLVTMFVLPIRGQLVDAATDLPGTVAAAARGKGPVGKVVTGLHLQSYVRDHQSELRSWAQDVENSSWDLAQTAVVGVLGALTVFVLAFFMLSQASAIGDVFSRTIPSHRRVAARRVANDIGAAVSGYMIGNLIISFVAGATAFITLSAFGVPNAAVLSLWVAFADLIPLVGATLGAVVAVAAAFLHSSTAGVVAIGFFVVYQQFENSVLQPKVMAKTVNVNPLVVLLSVLIGVELFGYLGALLAIPVAGGAQVVAKGIMAERARDRLLVRPDYDDLELDAAN